MALLLGSSGAQSSFLERIYLPSKRNTLGMSFCGCVEGALLLAHSSFQLLLQSLVCRFESQILLLAAAINAISGLMCHPTLSTLALLVRLKISYIELLAFVCTRRTKTCEHKYR